MTQPQQYINIILSDGDSMQVIADVDVEVTPGEWIETNPETGEGYHEPIHLANLLAGAILQRLISQDQAVINPGKYTVRLLATVVGAADE